jgi:signal transduction histidine kinase
VSCDNDTARPETNADPPELGRDRALEKALEGSVVRTIFEAAGTAMFIIDEDRRVVATNGLARAAARISPDTPVAGRRLGDILRCTHTKDAASLCGTEAPCKVCGGRHAISESREHGRVAEEECLLTHSRDGVIDSAEIHVIATPLELGGRSYTLVSMRDISDEKRRRTLERVFVHDLSNTVASLSAWVDLLDDPEPGIRADAASRVQRLTGKILDEMRSHSLISRVESAEFVPTWQARTPAEVMEQAAAAVAPPSEEGDAALEIAEPVPREPFDTDAALLGRVLVNMLRNAVEASPGGPIRLACARAGDRYRFSVSNPGAIPEDVAARIFRRSFSTKAPCGRGLGTYSMKLFGERILGGSVGFTTSADETTFFIDHPITKPGGDGRSGR